jgi:hypothetical protein
MTPIGQATSPRKRYSDVQYCKLITPANPTLILITQNYFTMKKSKKNSGKLRLSLDDLKKKQINSKSLGAISGGLLGMGVGASSPSFSATDQPGNHPA